MGGDNNEWAGEAWGAEGDGKKALEEEMQCCHCVGFCHSIPTSMGY